MAFGRAMENMNARTATHLEGGTLYQYKAPAMLEIKHGGNTRRRYLQCMCISPQHENSEALTSEVFQSDHRQRAGITILRPSTSELRLMAPSSRVMSNTPQALARVKHSSVRTSCPMSVACERTALMPRFSRVGRSCATTAAEPKPEPSVMRGMPAAEDKSK